MDKLNVEKLGSGCIVGLNYSMRVLFVDDDKSIRDMGEQFISRLGYEIDGAESGEMALEFLANREYGLVITDITMPGMDGWQLAKQIKKKYKELNVAIITGFLDDFSQERKSYYGVRYVIEKPFSMKQLKGLIKSVSLGK